MENMKYAEELVREFLVFRGFTKTLRAYESDLSTDIGKGFQAHKITDLVFSVYVPKFEFQSLVGLLNFLKQCFFSPNDAHLNSTMAKLEVSILKYYIVFALQRNRLSNSLISMAMNCSRLPMIGLHGLPYLT
eukprot:TRINITY_DN4455_c0_g1_i1.p1 TRINITY_DN4455_c0_g1~~TRINITY_DN4455_c0_g1_i1.p1  ORF type:complete len:132 (-),score=9.25 TRINITY_DN4455_c0_g1_i1:17-412(-)